MAHNTRPKGLQTWQNHLFEGLYATKFAKNAQTPENTSTVLRHTAQHKPPQIFNAMHQFN